MDINYRIQEFESEVRGNFDALESVLTVLEADKTIGRGETLVGVAKEEIRQITDRLDSLIAAARLGGGRYDESE